MEKKTPDSHETRILARGGQLRPCLGTIFFLKTTSLYIEWCLATDDPHSQEFWSCIKVSSKGSCSFNWVPHDHVFLKRSLTRGCKAPKIMPVVLS